MRTIGRTLALLVASFAAHGASCQDLERSVERQVSMLAVAADDLGLFRTIGNEAIGAVKQCPNSARLWYLAARAAEVLEAPMDGKAFAESGGLKQILADALSHAPQSAAIATIAARQNGGVPTARKAMVLDPGYAPAREALAIALAKEGLTGEALRLSSVKMPTGADHLARARVMLAAGRAAEAADEAGKALRAGSRDLTEPTPDIEIQRDANEVLGFALLKQGRSPEAQKALRIAASAGSVAAQHQISQSK